MRDSLLSYAEIVKIIDPYFNFCPITGPKTTEERYLKPIKMICENLANRHGSQNIGEVEIHTSVKAISKYEGYGKKVLRWEYTDKWQNQIKHLENTYGHKITIYIWEEKKEKDEWHDRYIDTTHFLVSMGKGSDESNWTDSTWTLVQKEKAEKISNKFKKKSIYTLIATVNAEKGLEKQHENIDKIQSVRIKNTEKPYISKKKGLRIVRKNSDKTKGIKNSNN